MASSVPFTLRKSVEQNGVWPRYMTHLSEATYHQAAGAGSEPYYLLSNVGKAGYVTFTPSTKAVQKDQSVQYYKQPWVETPLAQAPSNFPIFSVNIPVALGQERHAALLEELQFLQKQGATTIVDLQNLLCHHLTQGVLSMESGIKEAETMMQLHPPLKDPAKRTTAITKLAAMKLSDGKSSQRGVEVYVPDLCLALAGGPVLFFNKQDQIRGVYVRNTWVVKKGDEKLKMEDSLQKTGLRDNIIAAGKTLCFPWFLSARALRMKLWVRDDDLLGDLNALGVLKTKERSELDVDAIAKATIQSFSNSFSVFLECVATCIHASFAAGAGSAEHNLAAIFPEPVDARAIARQKEVDARQTIKHFMKILEYTRDAKDKEKQHEMAAALLTKIQGAGGVDRDPSLAVILSKTADQNKNSEFLPRNAFDIYAGMHRFALEITKQEVALKALNLTASWNPATGHLNLRLPAPDGGRQAGPVASEPEAAVGEMRDGDEDGFVDVKAELLSKVSFADASAAPWSSLCDRLTVIKDPLQPQPQATTAAKLYTHMHSHLSKWLGVDGPATDLYLSMLQPRNTLKIKGVAYRVALYLPGTDILFVYKEGATNPGEPEREKISESVLDKVRARDKDAAKKLEKKTLPRVEYFSVRDASNIGILPGANSDSAHAIANVVCLLQEAEKFATEPARAAAFHATAALGSPEKAYDLGLGPWVGGASSLSAYLASSIASKEAAAFATASTWVMGQASYLYSFAVRAFLFMN